MADFCCVDLLDEADDNTSARRAAVNHRDESKVDDGPRAGPLADPTEDGRDPVGQALGSGTPVAAARAARSGPRASPSSPSCCGRYEQLRPRSAIVVPLRARGQVLGALTLGTELPYGRRYSQRDLHLAADLAGARGPRGRQRPALRPRARRGGDPAAQPAARRAADARACRWPSRYLAATTAPRSAATGTTCCPLPDGAVGLAVGDVVGHDLRAAAAMGQLRGVLRSYAWEGLGPATVLDRCDDLVQGLGMAAMATAVYAPPRARAPTAAGGCATPTPATRRRCCAAPTAASSCSPATSRR